MRTFNLYKQKPIYKTMKNANHTPGAWRIKVSGYCQDDPCRWEIIDENNGIIAETNDSTNDANARLISAAPDLLSALQECVSAVEEIIGISDHGIPSESEFPLEKARAALRKAKGGAK